ncbi:MAG: hypothetical protein EHM85_16455 [Desulfobacteraceae bacterium]|nr:MAG: hypothetical protein EHM85_16455 [Desulfobacteraceae bacterium]
MGEFIACSMGLQILCGICPKIQAKETVWEILEWRMMLDHVHMCLKIPPNYNVAYSVEFLKGRGASG